MKQSATICALGAAVLLSSGAAAVSERVVYLEEFDHLAERTELFNEGAGVVEWRPGCLMLNWRAKTTGGFHKRWFKVETPPRERDWSFTFRFRLWRWMDGTSFGIRFHFGDGTETRMAVIREAGSSFEGGKSMLPPPREGDPGFLFGRGEAACGIWNRGAVTVSDGRATLWLLRGGKLAPEATCDFPKGKPLVGWNLVATEADACFGIDRVAIADGVARPYERGDIEELLAEVRPDDVVAWDPTFGTALEKKVDTPFDCTSGRRVIRFRAPFAAGRKGGAKAVGCAFEFKAGTNRPERIAFGASDIRGEPAFARFHDGEFDATAVPVVASNVTLTVNGYHRGVRILPSFSHWGGFETAELTEVAAARDRFPKPADTTWELALEPSGTNRYRVLINNQMLREYRFASPLTSVRFTGGEGAEARLGEGRAQPAHAWELPVVAGGFRLDRCRENLGSFAFECSRYLSRDAFDGLRSSCLFNVPRRQWARAKGVFRIDPTAPPSYVPVVTARLTHFASNGGRSLAMCQETIDLSKKDPRVVRKGDLYEVTFDFDIASIMDLTSMKEGYTYTELSYLHFEFTGPLWEKSCYYIDPWRSPANELRSNLIVVSGRLEESPAFFRVMPERPYSLYYPGETPQAKVDLAPSGAPGAKGALKLETEVVGEGGRVVQRVAYGAGSRTLSFPKDTGYGHYTVRYRVTDESGAVLQRYESSYGLLPPNTREGGYETPWYSWNFKGAHGTPRKLEEWAPAYHYLGVKRTLLDANVPSQWETNELMRAHGFTHAEFPFIRVPKDKAGREKAIAKMRRLVEAFPHCKQALVYHESCQAPFPREIYGEKTVWTERDKERFANDTFIRETAERTARAWREVDPTVRLIYGNSRESIGLHAQLMRGGLPKELADAWGEESFGYTHPPEESTALYPWCTRRIATILGYPTTQDCPWEWKCRTERYERSNRGAAAVDLRDALIGLALGYRTIPVGCGTEIANSYADTIWCGGTFTRWPMAYPREEALVTATLTDVLDGATYSRQLETGSLTAYALEFAAKGGRRVYALWTARGATVATLPKGEYEVISMTGARSASDGAAVAISDEPVWVRCTKPIDRVTVRLSRTFEVEVVGARDGKVVATLDAAEKVTLDARKDVRLDKGYANTPHRPGRFAVRTVKDEERGAALELEHLSQEACPEIMSEYVVMRLKEPAAVAEPFDTIGVWVKGNSSWGRVSFEIVDAEGERWYSSGSGGNEEEGDLYDWPAKAAFNYDGWHFLQLPFTPQSPVTLNGPCGGCWVWTRDASGNGKVDWPVKVTAVGVTQRGRTLDLIEMKPSDPRLRFGAIQVK